MSIELFKEEPFYMNYNYEEINKNALKQKLKDVLRSTINDLPFGKTISDEYKKALKKVIYYIMYYNKTQKIATIPMATGGGKSTALINAISFMANDPILYPYSGTIILKLEQKDCEETANAINKKADREIAYAYHSGKGENKRPKNQISKKKLLQYPVLVMCHEGYKELSRHNDCGRILNWTNAKVHDKYSQYNLFTRKRLIIDEEMSNVQIQNITLDTITLVENSILNMGNKYLFNAFNKFITQIKEEFLKPYDIKRNSAEFIKLNVYTPDKLDKYIFNYGDKATQEAYFALLDLVRHGGYVQYSDDINKKCITTYSYININNPMFYTVQLDATAKINCLYDINDDFILVDLPDFKTYQNTYIHIFDKITGSKSTIQKGLNEGLLESCIRDIKSKANKDDKILIIINNKEYLNLFKEKFFEVETFKPESYHGCPNEKYTIIDFTYYGAFTGKNTWVDYNKLFLIGIPIYGETTYPILYKVNSKTEDFLKLDTTLIPLDGARRYLQKEFEEVRVSIIAKELIQGINRIRCRLYDKGDTPEAHIYMINKDKEIDKLIKKAMPDVNILYDWNLDYEHKYNNSKQQLTNEEILINKIKEIQDNPVYRQLLIAKEILTDKGIKKKDLRELCGIKSKQIFSRTFKSPMFLQFCTDRQIDISNPQKHYLEI